jgi:2-keto-3-deoxy-galactonokinase
MTGELYAVLLSHSILGRMAAETAALQGEGAAFAAWRRARSSGDGLAHAIFGARTLALAAISRRRMSAIGCRVC